MKKLPLNILAVLMILLGVFTSGETAHAQAYNNEWIRYDRPYYKFKIGAKGLYKIPQSVLANAGLANVPVENLELWRNGEPVPFYPSVSSGILPSDGYIEFWGIPNDGKPDRPMYRRPEYQHTDLVSLLTDTASYFLSTGNRGFKVTQEANPVAANVLPAEQYFTYTLQMPFKARQNMGYANIVGEYVYSSSYDKGEFWSTAEIRKDQVSRTTSSNLQVYTGGPATATIKFGAFGNALNTRRVELRINDVILKDTIMDYFSDVHTTVEFPVSLIASNSAKTEFFNRSEVAADRMVISYFEMTYPRTFNFNNLRNFEFSLPAKADGYYLEITNFNHGNVAPALYDLTSGKRYIGDISQAGRVKFALPSQTETHNFVLVNLQPAYSTNITSLEKREFIDYSNPANQGDYIIISHPILYSGTNGMNPVQAYADYRSSVNGGSHKVIVVEIDQLVDQFAFGIKKHPLSIKNFLRYARNTFSMQLTNVFLIGRGMAYNEYARNQQNYQAELLNLVPTFGNPASDNMLSSEGPADPIPVTPIGRLSAINAEEVENYLEKVIEYETIQRTGAQNSEERAWMKNFVHVTGASEPYLGTVLCNYMNVYANIIKDTLYGANVSSFCKVTVGDNENLTTERIKQLMDNGIGILNYFGHSSSTTLEFNLDNPNAYSNTDGRYPIFLVNGCNAGNFFTYNIQRLLVNETLSEKFVLAKRRGSIAFVASTHYGIVNYLNYYLNKLYHRMGGVGYGATLGELNRDALKDMVTGFGEHDFYSRAHAEEITIHGDPAIKYHADPLPDYEVQNAFLKLNPSLVSIADNNFDFTIKVRNIGKAVSDSVMIRVLRTYPDGSEEQVFKNYIGPVKFEDSLVLSFPIIATRDKGNNKFKVTVDPDNEISEKAEYNNEAEINFFIYEEEAIPVYPFEFAIINRQDITLFASTANPFSPERNYILEIDTTLQFNSSLKVTRSLVSAGGILEFNPGISFLDSTVYYWRVAPEPPQGEEFIWNTSSFVYIAESTPGWNQSHFYQHKENQYSNIILNDERTFRFDTVVNNLLVKASLYPYGSNQAFYKGNVVYQGGCGSFLNSFEFAIFDIATGKPRINTITDGEGEWGSFTTICPDNSINKPNQYVFRYNDPVWRKKTMDFLDSIPNGSVVSLMNWGSVTFNSNPKFIDEWQNDTLIYGPNQSIYHKFMEIGLTEIDSFYRNIPFIFIFKKDFDGTWEVMYQGVGRTQEDLVEGSVNFNSNRDSGYIRSKIIGPAKNWQSAHWKGKILHDDPGASVKFEFYGLTPTGYQELLYSSDKQNNDTLIDFISASQYPYLRLVMKSVDSTQYVPYQLDYWQVKYEELPEGAVDPKLSFNFKDTVEAGEMINFRVAFRNISSSDFDSLLYRIVVTDKNNVQHVFNPARVRGLPSGDSIIFNYAIDSRNLTGSNTAFVEVNPDNDQLEQLHSNNFFYHEFYVKPDRVKPVMDVTFDGVHILNRDIVSAKPHIRIKLEDNSKYLLLSDTSIAGVQIRYPNGSVRTYHFDGDTLRFTPASSGEDNVAYIDFYPDFTNQMNPEGDDYELMVIGKDMSGNKAGEIEYRVGFRVISKPMISNLLNYPNPFSTSTAFVFTITGSEIPQNLKIQILTVTGKVVREITKEELGPLKIGRNITEFKWDGTDMYGQKLANGVYLYRMVATLDGQRMEKYKAEGENTDRFFSNGYGKMYLMR